MGGFAKIYCIGGKGGLQGADGINPIALQIWLGEGDRQWLEGHAFDPSIRPLGGIKTVIPEKPNHPDALLDACLAFHPNAFESCPALAEVRRAIGNAESLDFNLGKSKVPAAWPRLREEARPVLRGLVIFEAALRPIKR